jgi:hypothetical protein
LTGADERGGRRLDDREDFAGLGIEAALPCSVPVLPILGMVP